MKPTDISVSQTAIRQARQCGLWTDTEARIKGLAARSVHYRSEIGNRAYGPFVMLMQGTKVLTFAMIGPVEVDARPVTDCKLCHGLTVLRRDNVARPCPRAYDTGAPLCDTLVRKT